MLERMAVAAVGVVFTVIFVLLFVGLIGLVLRILGLAIDKITTNKIRNEILARVKRSLVHINANQLMHSFTLVENLGKFAIKRTTNLTANTKTYGWFSGSETSQMKDFAALASKFEIGVTESDPNYEP